MRASAESVAKSLNRFTDAAEKLQERMASLRTKIEPPKPVKPTLTPVVVHHAPQEVEVKMVQGPSVTKIRLSAIDPAPWRYSDPTEVEQAKLQSMIKMRGQLIPLHLRVKEDMRFEIISGHRIYEALKALNVPTAWAVTHKCSEDEAKLIALELNENKSETDYVALAALLNYLVKKIGAPSVAQCVGLTQEQVESYSELGDLDWNKYSQGENDEAQQVGMEF